MLYVENHSNPCPRGDFACHNGFMYSTFSFAAADGTKLEGWTNNGKGPIVVISNGLGVPPEAWPRLLDPDCGYQVYSWNHRGTLGSDRPTDIEAIRVDDHVSDGLAMMDFVGIERAIFVAWSFGVNVSFEIAKREPDKVAGLLMLAGVPGGTLDAAFAPLMVPKPLRKPLANAAVKTAKTFSVPLNLFARTLPKNKQMADVLRYTGFMMPYAKSEDIVPWMKAFLEHDFWWYFHMFPAAGEHAPIDPSFVECPITVAAGGFDSLASMRDIVDYAEKIPHAEIHILHGTHFLPLEFPDEIMAMLDGLLQQTDLVGDQVTEVRESVVDLTEINGRWVHQHRTTEAS